MGRIPSVSKSYNGYEGCYPIDYLLKTYSINTDDSILDIGCGKGLFLYYAKKHNFGMIHGIEYLPELYTVALSNFSHESDPRIGIFCCDATTFDQYQKYNWYFINNPFSKEITRVVAQRIKESIDIQPRQIHIIYQFPSHIDMFLNNGFTIEYQKFPNAVLTFIP